MKSVVNFTALCITVRQAICFFCLHCKSKNPKAKTAGILTHENLQGNIQNGIVGYGVLDRHLCLTTAGKKIAQLRANPTHISSYQSRNPEKGFWGGGFFVPGVGYFALSGLPEAGDEVCLMCGLLHERIVLPEYTEKALALSNNLELFSEVLTGTLTKPR